MNKPTDILGKDLEVGQRVGVAFSYSQASVGHIRLGTIEEIDMGHIVYYGSPEVILRVRWENGNKLSPKIKYGNSNRWIVL